MTLKTSKVTFNCKKRATLTSGWITLTSDSPPSHPAIFRLHWAHQSGIPASSLDPSALLLGCLGILPHWVGIFLRFIMGSALPYSLHPSLSPPSTPPVQENPNPGAGVSAATWCILIFPDTARENHSHVDHRLHRSWPQRHQSKFRFCHIIPNDLRQVAKPFKSQSLSSVK